MSFIIHCRRVDGTLVYRIWSTATDTYATDVITADQARDFIVEDEIARVREQAPRRAEQWLQRASENGTSSTPLRTPLSDPWDAELCWSGRQSHFHHPFEARSRSTTCAECGEVREHIGHSPPCKP